MRLLAFPAFTGALLGLCAAACSNSTPVNNECVPAVPGTLDSGFLEDAAIPGCAPGIGGGVVVVPGGASSGVSGSGASSGSVITGSGSGSVIGSSGTVGSSGSFGSSGTVGSSGSFGSSGTVGSSGSLGSGGIDVPGGSIGGASSGT
jgi:hypothetical protein